ncbi:2'-5' RNA ligase family protein [Streptomyces galbus]|uniref:2'-5' RNA ligase family protein n=1 Tax=Streptomyces galbus TaxID=33898 RepID=UPI003826AE08
MPQLVVDDRSFPAIPPEDLDDASKIVANDWAAFCGIDRMTNHWDRPGWTPQHTAYYWMLTFPGQQELIEATHHCQQQIAEPALDLVPSDGLHVTVAKVGDTAALHPADVEELVRRAHIAVPSSFALTAHPLAGSRGAVRFSITPWTPLVRLHKTLATTGQAVGVPGGKPTAAFRPHLGIAYNNCDRPAGPVIERVALLRANPAIAMRIQHVDLVELRREGAAYRWDVIRRVPLAS